MAQVAVTMTSEDARLWQGMQKLIAQQTKMEKGFGKVGQSARRAGDHSRKAFGPTAIKQIGTFAASFGTAAKTIGFVTNALREADQVRREVVQRMHTSAAGLGLLGQLAESPKEMKELVSQAKGIYREGGATDVEQAARTLFALKSAGAEEFLPLFTELKKKELVAQPDVMARSAKALMSSLGIEETGTFRDLISKAFGASKTTPAVAESLLQAAAGPGAFAKPLGLSDEELLAMVAVLSKQAKGEDPAAMAGTWVRSLLKGLGEAGEFEGMSVAEILKDIGGRKLDEKALKGRKLSKEERKALIGQPLDVEGLKKIIGGRSEAMVAYRGLLDNLEDFQAILADVRLAEREDRVSKKLSYADVIPELRGTQLAKTRRARKELAQRRIGREQMLADSLLDEMAARNYEMGVLPAFVPGAERVHRGLQSIIGPRAYLRVMEPFASPELRHEMAGVTGRTDQLLEKLIQVNEETNRIARQRAGAATLAHPDDDPGARHRE